MVLSIREYFWIVLILGLIKLILIPTWSTLRVLFLRFFLSSGCISHLCQVIYRITSGVPRILLLTALCSHVLINEIVLFLEIAGRLRALLIGTTLSWYNIPWLWSLVSLFWNVLSWAFLIRIVLINRLIGVVSIITDLLWVLRITCHIISILNVASIWSAWILWSLISISIPRIYRVSFSSSSHIFNFRLYIFGLRGSTKTSRLSGSAQLLLWSIFAWVWLKIIIITIRIQISFQRASSHLLLAISVMNSWGCAMLRWLARLRSGFLCGSSSWWNELLRRSVNITVINLSSISFSLAVNKIWLTVSVICFRELFLHVLLALSIVTSLSSLRARVSLVRLSTSWVNHISWRSSFLKILARPISIILGVVRLSISWWLHFRWTSWVLLRSNGTIALNIGLAYTAMTLNSLLICIVTLILWLTISTFVLIMSIVSLINSI